jgi:hypothetical protein
MDKLRLQAWRYSASLDPFPSFPRPAPELALAESLMLKLY